MQLGKVTKPIEYQSFTLFQNYEDLPSSPFLKQLLGTIFSNRPISHVASKFKSYRPRVHRCECLLALWMLRSDSEVAFMDEDRLGVLTLKVAKEALEKIDLL